MTISTLSNQIHLPREMQCKVLAFAEGFDFSLVEELLQTFRQYEKMPEALAELRVLLGEDADHVGILACMLRASADLHELYREKGISDAVYFATMGCYTRFLEETRRMTGRLTFDREWWTTRQAGGHLFRLGALEYEMKHTDRGVVIGMHIPSDADFSPEAVDASLRMAGAFFAAHFPALSGAEYRCHSWLLDPQLQGMLREDSHILSFQRRFDLFDEGEASDEFLEWLYRTRSADAAALPEGTSLQRNVKRHLLAGGVIRNTYGRLRQ